MKKIFGWLKEKKEKTEKWIWKQIALLLDNTQLSKEPIESVRERESVRLSIIFVIALTLHSFVNNVKTQCNVSVSAAKTFIKKKIRKLLNGKQIYLKSFWKEKLNNLE